MAYRLSKSAGDSVAVPQLVFSRLADVEDDWVRVALHIIATGDAQAESIARTLRLKSADKAREALLFWKGVGLLEDEDGGVSKRAASIDSAPEQRSHLTTPEVTRAAVGDKAIASLVQECQRLMGGIITQADTNIFVSMYVTDDMPVDMILLGVAHFAALGKRSARYIERALLGWQREGINTGAAAEAYLHQLATREEYASRVARVFGMPEDAKLTKADCTLVCEWFEGFGYDEAMIAEAVAYAGEHRTVKYVNGILRRWYAKGFKTVRDVMQDSATSMQNVQVSNPTAKSVLNGARRAPTFHTGGNHT